MNPKSRKEQSFHKRKQAAQIAYDRPHHEHRNNGDEKKYGKTAMMSFSKGLVHNHHTGLVANIEDFLKLRKGINDADTKVFEEICVALKKHYCHSTPWKSEKANTGGKDGTAVPIRLWESSGAGIIFDTQGPDAQSVTMPPAPKLGSDELTAEMAEVYAQALLRDIPLAAFSKEADTKTVSEAQQKKADQIVKCIEPIVGCVPRGAHGFKSVNAFRGLTKGDQVGPYLSQFMLAGNTGVNGNDPERSPKEGIISYGAQEIYQTVRDAVDKDYLQNWEEYIDVQNGADLRGLEGYSSTNNRKFITTGRDLATYVHYDALYQAYLNACLLCLGMSVKGDGVKYDVGIPFQGPDREDYQQGFAHFGGPHILSLVTEVATRALKAVRYQKFNIHLRLRPEALAARLHKLEAIKEKHPHTDWTDLYQLCKDLDPILDKVKAKNLKDTKVKENCLLPMAFCEGSPMHPTYGAGHATVAGACVTILKAFFNCDLYLHISKDGDTCQLSATPPKHQYAYVPTADGKSLTTVPVHEPLTLEGELNKLAANISIGRNWAGVHYYSDYAESLKMGEKIAIGILQEQSIMFNEHEGDFHGGPFMSLKPFHGKEIFIQNGAILHKKPKMHVKQTSQYSDSIYA